MAFSSTITATFVAGSKRIAFGTFTNASGDTGGDITTGLAVVDAMWLQYSGTAVVADAPVINETFPLTTAVTIVTVDNADGYWIAIGR